MSIQTELTRLTNAKAAIKTAIEGKGVTVPSGTLLDGMAALIESIETGGGGLKYVETTFILAEDTTTDYVISIDPSPLLNEDESLADFILGNCCTVIIFKDYDQSISLYVGDQLLTSMYITMSKEGTRAAGIIGQSGYNINSYFSSNKYRPILSNTSITCRFTSDKYNTGYAGSAYRCLIVRTF